ncbi:LuxR C-terminal-related transcriptional regulator [Streptomyces sp. NPDC016566]|uniref:LuxR C-terminal-related transcriptional regulator n=1 Tax=Streptomyces sp. NPDC016566 TaxID=3364967 RepID=UPI003702B946
MDEMDKKYREALSPLSEAELALYTFAVERADVCRDELPQVGGVAAEDLAAAFESLTQRRLLLPVMGDNRRYAAAPPDATVEALIRPVVQQARTARDAADRLRRELVPVYESALERRLRQPLFEELPDVASVRRALDRFAAEAQHEVLTSQPGGGRTEEVLQEAMGRTEAMLRRGVRMRTLYQHTAHYNPGTHAYVEIVTGLGAEVRTLCEGFMRMIAFDGETVVIEQKGNSKAALVVREPSMVSFAVAAFELMWLQADPFPVNLGRAQAIQVSDKTKENIIRLLVQGESDKVIARRMGMTVRTCQRHIVKIMERIDAKSRVHAGYLLREYGGNLGPSDAPDRSGND